MVCIRLLRSLAGPAFVLASSTAFCLSDPPNLKFKVNSKWSSNAVVRCGRAVATVVSISYDYKSTLWGVDRQSQEYNKLMSEVHWRSAARLKHLCCINGGIYIKGAQYISALDYLLPHEYVTTMKVFHNDAPQSTIQDVYQVIQDSLGESSKKLFKHFDEVPIGAASLAQVHKATLHDGRVVAVKVQHKDIQEHVTVDIYTIEFLTNAVSWLFPEFRFKWLIEETKKNIPLEMDFLHEGRNAEKVSKMFSNCKFLKVPRIVWDHSSKRVLMMEFCEGGKVDDLEYMQKNGISSDEVSRKIGELYSEMIFETGYVHCDPHPGNVLVRMDDTDNVEIVLLDHGLYQQLSDEFRVQYCKLWQSLIASDVEGIKHYSDKMGVGDLYGLFACMLTSRAWSVVTSGIDSGPVTENEVREIRDGVTTYISNISDILERVPRQLLLILKTNDLLRSIDYQLNTSAAAKSFVTMSRCCIRAVTKQQLENCCTWECWFKAHASSLLGHARISFYQFYVSDLVRKIRSFLSIFGLGSIGFKLPSN